jgi:hypothetical protein
MVISVLWKHLNHRMFELWKHHYPCKQCVLFHVFQWQNSPTLHKMWCCDSTIQHNAQSRSIWTMQWHLVKAFLTAEVTLQHESSNLFPNNIYEAYLIYFSLTASLLYCLYNVYHLLHNSSLCSSTPVFSSLQLWNTKFNLHAPGSHCCDSCS